MPVLPTYYAPKPRLKPKNTLKSIASWAFPPTAIWKGIKIGVNKLAGEKVGLMLNPAQKNHRLKCEAYWLRYNFMKKVKHKPVTVNTLIVSTYDTASLDSLELYPNELSDKISSRPHIIYFPGSRSCFEYKLNLMLDDAHKLQAKVIGFNYRGVCDSDSIAKSKKDNAVDGIAQVQRLIDQGVDPKMIFLKGNSYGGAVAAVVARHFHEKGQKISVVPINVFSTLTNEVVGLIRIGKYSEAHEKLKKNRLATLTKPFIKLMLASTGWDVDTLTAYKIIPEEYKEYMQVRSRKSIRACRKDDGVIPYPASLHVGLRPERRQEKKSYIKKEGYVPASIKSKFNSRKFETPMSQMDGHITPLNQLTNRYGVNGQQFFQRFVSHGCEENLEQQPIASAACKRV